MGSWVLRIRMSIEKIAQRLEDEEGWVRKAAKNILRKLGVSSKTAEGLRRRRGLDE